ncbi:efflux RND transporter periplasmic adaptor subunit [Halorhodospira abdelmalekii]|uniref:efflux RND transporter periplasmic adaptor subunit n=1 Tax=Halorhodospira abdelmalekii TaxID=421629 RepID=UPI001F5BD529|nr:efflux RND transporter periplasmic adaptor subunit [Halorhodospira abdelmalekii]
MSALLQRLAQLMPRLRCAPGIAAIRPALFSGGALLTLLLLGALLSGCEQEQGEPAPASPRPVKTLILDDPTALVERRFTGRTEAAQRAWVAFRVGGEIVELTADIGDRVEAGALLGRLDPRDFRHEVAELDSTLEAATARRAHARAEYRRAAELFADGAISHSEYDRTARQREEAEADVTALRARLAHARDRLADTELRAPFAGAIAARRFEPEEAVQPQEPVFLLENLERLEVEVGLPEELIGYREQIEQIVVRIPALDGAKFPGELQRVATGLLPERQTYPVRIAIQGGDEGDERLLPGMTAEVIFGADLHQATDRFRLPPAALFEYDGAPHVWLRDPEEGRVARQRVEVIAFDRDRVVVGGGLEAGDEVVVAGVAHLRPDQPTRRLPAEGP